MRPNAADYPEGLRRLTPAPNLWLRGALPSAPAFAVIGSRYPDPEAEVYTRQLAATLAREGWCVVSGGAKGIDTAAHVGALAVGGQTLAVITGDPHGPHYPEENSALFEEIVRHGGGLLSRQGPGAHRMRPHFLMRNAVLVAICAATIVVQARLDGGAIKAARTASRLGLPVFVVPSAPWQWRAGGTLRALRRGARPLWCLEDAIEQLRPYAVPTLTDAQAAIFAKTGFTPIHVDKLCAELGQRHAVIAAELLELTLDGHLVEDPPGHYRRKA